MKIGVLSATLALAACSSVPLLKTGSLLPASQTKAVAEATPAGPIDRALHVGALSARAQRCGYNFNEASLRANYLASEAQRGTVPAILVKTTQAYDYTRKTINGKITDSEAYCNTERNAAIKKSLQRALAGDFEPAPKTKVAQSGSFFDIFEADDDKKEVFNPDGIYDPILGGETTKEVEPE